MGHRELGPTPAIVESKAPGVNPKFSAEVFCRSFLPKFSAEVFCRSFLPE
jgi:hypothetical protein